jgi:hypothetical protein
MKIFFEDPQLWKIHDKIPSEWIVDCIKKSKICYLNSPHAIAEATRLKILYIAYWGRFPPIYGYTILYRHKNQETYYCVDKIKTDVTVLTWGAEHDNIHLTRQIAFIYGKFADECTKTDVLEYIDTRFCVRIKSCNFFFNLSSLIKKLHQSPEAMVYIEIGSSPQKYFVNDALIACNTRLLIKTLRLIFTNIPRCFAINCIPETGIAVCYLKARDIEPQFSDYKIIMRNNFIPIQLSCTDVYITTDEHVIKYNFTIE